VEVKMKASKSFLLALAYIGFVGLFTTTRGDEEKIGLDKLPKAVLQGVKKRFPQAELKGAEKEREEGQTLYEVAIRDGEQNVEVTLTPKGVITEIEKRIEARDVPRAAADALEKRYPKATYKIVEEVFKVKDGEESLEYYEVLLVSAEKKRVEVSVTSEGKIVKEEKKSGGRD
jgi:hypothetical protein